jgi:hypothetical protein
MLVMHGVNTAYLVLKNVAAEVPKVCKEKQILAYLCNSHVIQSTGSLAGGLGWVGFAVPYLIAGPQSAKLKSEYDAF